MSGFGGSIKLTGESSYRKALSEITQSLKVVSAEMKATSSSMASGDKSTQELATTSKQLSESLEKQKQALGTLKTQLSSMQAEYNKTAQSHQALLSKYNNEKEKLDEIGRTLGTSSKEYKNQQKVVNDLTQEVNKSTKTLDSQGKSINDMRIKTANAEAACNQTAQALDKLGKEAEESGKQAIEGGDGFTILKGVLADLGSQAIQKAMSGLKQLGQSIVNVGKQSYNLYAHNEQLVGGVETLFGKSADTLIKYANEAYKTAGISANEYMEQATSFSATLLQGLGGNTKQAVIYTNRAIQDMSDNANKMGTDMYMIQNAYQGFAKQNYTMLDNLKLGYGGTQAEMARLINDSGVLGRSVKVTAETVKNVPFAKIIDAIHKTQQKIGITGTTVKEAEQTIEGSTKAMKAAWDNLLVGIASGDADISSLTNSWIEQVVAMGKNMIPRVKEIIKGMGELVKAVWNEVIPELAKEIPSLQPIVTAFNWVKDNADLIISALAGILAGFVAFKTITFIGNIVTTMQTLFTVIQTGIPIMQALNVVLNANPIGLIITAVAGLVAAFVALWKTSEDFRNFWVDLWDALKLAFEAAWNGIKEFFTTTIPEAFNSVKETILKWKDNIVEFFQEFAQKAFEVVQNVITFFRELPYNIGVLVGEALGHLTNFGVEAWNWVRTKVPEIIDGIVSFFKELPNKIWTWLQNTFNKISQWGNNAILKAQETGRDFVNSIISFLRDLPGKMWTWLQNGLQKVGEFATDIAKKGKEAAKNLFENVVEGIKELPGKIKEIGKNIVKGLWDGITGMKDWVIDKIKGFGSGILDGMKKALGINSPSKLFRDEVGKSIAEGIGVGFENEMSNVTKQMQDAIPTNFALNSDLNGSYATSNTENNILAMVEAFKEALYDIKIEMNDEEMGRFVDKTVTRLVYN